MKIEEADNYRGSGNRFIGIRKAALLKTCPCPLGNFFVVEENNNVVGVGGIEIYGEYGLLRSLAVHQDFRNKGIANELLLQVEKLAVEKKLKIICLLTETTPDYFQKKGYQIIARADVPAEIQQSSEFRHVCPQSAIVMQKRFD